MQTDDFSKIDIYRRRHLLFAELIDAWRIIPRAVVGAYFWLAIHSVIWYMNLKPYILEDCDISKLGETCIINSPSTQHAVVLTAVFGLGAGIFGFYAKSGRNWSEGVKSWKGLVGNSATGSVNNTANGEDEKV